MVVQTPSAGPEQVLHLKDDYDRLLPEIKQVPDAALLPINIDVQQAVTTAMGAWPKVHPFREQVTSETPQLDVKCFDQYEAYANALGFAHARYMTAMAPSGVVPPMAQKAVILRDQLLSDAQALAKRGLINSERLADLNGPVGFRNVAFDLVALVDLIRDNWDKIANKTAVEPQELEDADALGSQLVKEVGLREQGPAIIAETAHIRQQAFTLFVNNYDQVRRVISFLRWNEGDVDDIAPSLYAGRNTGKRKNGSDVQPAPAANPTTPSANAVAGQAKPNAGDATQPSEIATGLPGSSPLIK